MFSGCQPTSPHTVPMCAKIRVNLQETNMSDRNQCDGVNVLRLPLHMGFKSNQASKGHPGDVLAVRGDEGRNTLR